MKELALMIIGLLTVNLSFGQTTNKTNLNRSLIVQLDTILQEDQKYRLLLTEILAKSVREDSDNMKIITLSETIDEKDSINLLKIERILNDYGWLGADVLGEEGNKTIFLVIQHSDLETQLKYLPMMRKAVEFGNANAKDIALLEDRIAVRQGKRQIYGSQIYKDYNTGEAYVYPLVDPEKVNERRAKVGLEPIEDYVKNVGITWNIEKHKERTKKIEAEKGK
jgi:hypothetical protein